MKTTLVGLALVLCAVNGLVAQKEWVLVRGREVVLELAPRDPRSLMQGDYMELNYAVARALARHDLPRRGRAVVHLDPDGLAQLVRVDDGSPLGPQEQLLGFKRRDWRVLLGAESYFFQEGQAEVFARARFARLRVSRSGQSVLVGLLDEHRQPLGK